MPLAMLLCAFGFVDFFLLMLSIRWDANAYSRLGKIKNK